MNDNPALDSRILEGYPGHSNAKRRIAFTLSILEQATPEQRRVAMKKNNIKRNPLKRYGNMLRKTGSLMDGTRSGRPTKYPEAILELGVNMLVEHEDECITGTQLLEMLQDSGCVPPGSSCENFLAHLKKHVEKNGHRLITDSTRTTFFLRREDTQVRMQYCTSMIPLLTQRQLEMTIFTDETDYDEYPHPQGRNPMHSYMSACSCKCE